MSQLHILDTQVKEKTYLGPDGTFVTDEEYHKFVRQELIVKLLPIVLTVLPVQIFR